MYPFNFETSTEINTNTISLILTEESDVSDVHAYNLCYPDYFYGDNNRVIWVGVVMTDWINTIGRNSTFKQITKQFEIFCKRAQKLKI